MKLAEAVNATGVTVLDHLDLEVEVPLVTTAACQGDVSALRVTKSAATTPIPAQGIVVATGQGGHDHTIHGPAFFDRAKGRDGSLIIGRLTVQDGAEAIISHVEHGMLRFAPGTYEIGGQREFAGEWQRVAD